MLSPISTIHVAGSLVGYLLESCGELRLSKEFTDFVEFAVLFREDAFGCRQARHKRCCLFQPCIHHGAERNTVVRNPYGRFEQFLKRQLAKTIVQRLYTCHESWNQCRPATMLTESRNRHSVVLSLYLVLSCFQCIPLARRSIVIARHHDACLAVCSPGPQKNLCGRCCEGSVDGIPAMP